jgi:endonuclease YncB( thermonuclease family)
MPMQCANPRRRFVRATGTPASVVQVAGVLISGALVSGVLVIGAPVSGVLVSGVLVSGVLVSGTWFGAASARAQGLDMDAGPSAPAPAAHQSGDLDMDVNPDAPLAPKPVTRTVPRDNVQDGITPLNTRTTRDAPPAPGDEPSDTPSAPATVVQQPPPEPVIMDHPTVVDTAKLQSGATTVSLFGIEGMAGASAQGLQGFLGAGGGHVTCQAQATAGFVCLMADGTNVAQVALINGAAKTTPDAPDSYREQEAAAQAARRGIWANLPPPPETLRHPAAPDTATLVADGRTYVLDGVVGFQAPYSNQLQGYLAANGDSATCSPQNDAGHYICLMPDGTDVAKVALVNGAARVAQDAPDAYRVQQLDALNNRRGYWATAPEAVLTAALLPPEPDVQYTLVVGDDGVDGITYVGGAPVAVIDGESAFLVYGDDDLGWGYYDHYHHWHGAPDRFRHHMEHFHPGGHGLRGYDGFHRDAAMRGREEAMRHDAGRAGGFRPGMGGREDPMHAGGVRPGMGAAGPHPGNMAMAGSHPGNMAIPGSHPGNAAMAGGRPGNMAIAGGRPGNGAMAGSHPGNAAMAGSHPGNAAMAGARPGNMAMAGARPAGGGGTPGGGFMRPNPAASAGGYHPGAAPAVHNTAAAAPHAAAPHPSGGGGSSGKHK